MCPPKRVTGKPKHVTGNNLILHKALPTSDKVGSIQTSIVIQVSILDSNLKYCIFYTHRCSVFLKCQLEVNVQIKRSVKNQGKLANQASLF